MLVVEPCSEHCSKDIQRDPTSVDSLSNSSVMEDHQTHTQGSNRVLFSLAPNSHGELGVTADASQGWETTLGSYFKPEKAKPITEESIKEPRTQTDNRIRGTGQSANQQTLLNTLNFDWSHLDLEKHINVISLHGPSCEGPRTLMIGHHEVMNSRSPVEGGLVISF